MDQNQTGYSSMGEWELIKKLGAGGFGQVLLWRNNRTNQDVATKCLKRDNTLREEQVAKLKERWTKEIDWMCNLNTPYIVRAIELKDDEFEAYLDRQHEWSPLPVIKMEYCNGGDIRMLLQKPENANGLHEQEVRDIMTALRHAIQYLHTVCRIEHRDLKPDNIVIHRIGPTRYYKLTDFGFARELSETTVLKSVVGTRHYFAPEVVDTSQYTHTVDYWSAGVIAFEIMCGSLPFIPHQTLYNIITNIKNKPRACVAITENLNEDKQFIFEQHVFPETRMSSIFQRRMDEWLRLALDSNYKTRGKSIPSIATGEVQGQNSAPEFYTVLDAIVQTNILRVFCLNTGKFYYYEITANMTMESLQIAIQRDTNLKVFNLIFPVGHPQSHANEKIAPMDLFFEEWQDTSSSQTPPAMLYIVSYQNECNIGPPNISDTIKSLMKADNIPSEKVGVNWKLRKFMQHTHFLLSNEQRHLEAHLHGLKEFAMSVEHVLFNFEIFVKDLSNSIAMLIGKVQQFECMFEAAIQVHCNSEMAGNKNFHDQWRSCSEQLKSKVLKLSQSDITITKRYKSALRRAKEQANNIRFQKWVENDIYNVSTFRQYMLGNGRNITLDQCKKAIEYCLLERQRFYVESEYITDRNTIWDVSTEFSKIQQVVNSAIERVRQLNNEIIQATLKFQASLRDKQVQVQLINNNALNYDGATPSIFNGFDKDGFCDEEAMELIQETFKCMELMDVDAVGANDVNKVSLPKTIDELSQPK